LGSHRTFFQAYENVERTETLHIVVESEPVQCACPKILCVDDNSLNIMVTRGFLKKKGYDCDEAHNGKEAVQMVTSASQRRCCSGYKLVLMDIEMPIMNGYQVTLL
jgi:PleD family two-component response regulator